VYHVQSRRGIAVEVRRPGSVLLGTLAATVVVDQLTKALTRALLHPSQSVPVIEGVFHLTHVRNIGAAFGLMPGQRALFVTTSLLVLVAIGLYWWRVRPRGLVVSIALGLIAGGAVGNLIDRVLTGRVTDFFDFRIWPVFNMADTSIVIGAAGLFIWALLAPIEVRDPSSATQRSAGSEGEVPAEEERGGP